MRKFLIIFIILLITLTGCSNKVLVNHKTIVPPFFKEQISLYSTFNTDKLNEYYYSYLNTGSYIYALNLVNHPHFLDNGKIQETYNYDQLILVNKKFYLKENNFPDDLVLLTGIKHIKRTNEVMLIQEQALNSLLDMALFAKQKNIDLIVFSAFRSYQKQVSLWNNRSYIDSLFLAIPGHSEHHTGLAIDIGTLDSGLTKYFENTPVFNFLNEYAQNYGFILRYPKDKTSITGYAYEPWHYRYVGVEAAKIIKEQNLTLEEYLYQYTIIPSFLEP